MVQGSSAQSEIRARPVELADIEWQRARYRREARCQIVRDSILPRGLADPWLLEIDGRPAGYAGVWNKHFPGRMTEFYALADYRERSVAMVRALARASGARELEVQTNILDGGRLLRAAATDSRVENLLFEAGPETDLDGVDLTFRRRREDDAAPDGAWVLEEDGSVVASGGWLTHYNTPWVDLYMEVVEGARRRGVGAYLVQELRRACMTAGSLAAARCSPENEGSRRALERGGMVRCGEILVGDRTGAWAG